MFGSGWSRRPVTYYFESLFGGESCEAGRRQKPSFSEVNNPTGAPSYQMVRGRMFSARRTTHARLHNGNAGQEVGGWVGKFNGNSLVGTRTKFSRIYYFLLLWNRVKVNTRYLGSWQESRSGRSIVRPYPRLVLSDPKSRP